MRLLQYVYCTMIQKYVGKRLLVHAAFVATTFYCEICELAAVVGEVLACEREPRSATVIDMYAVGVKKDETAIATRRYSSRKVSCMLFRTQAIS